MSNDVAAMAISGVSMPAPIFDPAQTFVGSGPLDREVRSTRDVPPPSPPVATPESTPPNPSHFSSGHFDQDIFNAATVNDKLEATFREIETTFDRYGIIPCFASVVGFLRFLFGLVQIVVFSFLIPLGEYLFSVISSNLLSWCLSEPALQWLQLLKDESKRASFFNFKDGYARHGAENILHSFVEMIHLSSILCCCLMICRHEYYSQQSYLRRS